MAQLDKDDLAQMDRSYFQSLTHGQLVEVASNLHALSVEQWERLAKNSKNSSRPPSSDSPFDGTDSSGDDSSKKNQAASNDDVPTPDQTKGETTATGDPDHSEDESQNSNDPKGNSDEVDAEDGPRSPGRQPGAQGHWRKQKLVPSELVQHFPDRCSACNASLDMSDAHAKPYMGFIGVELERSGTHLLELRIICSLHHYYASECACGHETKEKPGIGATSEVEGRKRQLRLQEQVLVGPDLTSFIASLAQRYRMSREKIKEFLDAWFNLELCVGTIDRAIREAGFACHPVVQDILLPELRQAALLHMDETPWYERGLFKYLWVAANSTIAIFHIGSRKKEEFLYLVTATFMGWLVTDGYQAYRSHKWRQRCLAHLIRKAIGIKEGIDPTASKIGAWLLKELRRLIKTMAEGGEEARSKCNPVLARLTRACLIGEEIDHPKLQALSAEILDDWDAVVAFVKNPGLPPTNNFGERILRHVVMLRRITFGTRTEEGSLALADYLSVMETCRLRGIDPWDYIASVIANGRKGLSPPPLPTPTT